jgi:hypothetical protein
MIATMRAGRDGARRPRTRRTAVLVLAAFAATATLTACPEEKGPAEKAGEKVDEGAQKLKDAVSPPGPAEKLGRKIDKAAD